MTYEELNKYVADGPFKELVKTRLHPDALLLVPSGWIIFAQEFYLAGVEQGKKEAKLTEETS